MTKPERFWSKVAFTPKCWMWMAAKHPFGHGYFGVGRKLWRAHRYAWTLFHGQIPDGECVLHRCDVPSCVNPSHLFLGSRKDNRIDCVLKGRHAKGQRNRAVLNAAQVVEVRKRHSQGERQTEIAKSLGVSKHVVFDAIHRRWAWL